MTQYSPHSGAKEPNVSIIMLNWNNHKDTIECLKSLRQIDYPQYDIIILDNASTRNSILELLKYISNTETFLTNRSPIESLQSLTLSRQEITNEKKIRRSLNEIKPPRTILIKNEKNYGFAGGNNIGADFALEFLDPEYLLLINNDVITDQHFLTELVNVAKSSEKIGIVGPKIYYEDFCGRKDIINFAGEDIVLWKAKGVRHGYDKKDNGQFDKVREVDKIDGSCMLIKRKVLEKIGLFESAFFAYWEETDLCIRAKNSGFKVVYAPKSRIWHKIASSTGGFYSNNRTFLFTRNRFFFIKRNGRPVERFMFLLYFFFWDFWYSMAQFVKNRQLRILPAFIRGILAGIRILL